MERAIEGPHQHHLEAVLPGVRQELIETWPLPQVLSQHEVARLIDAAETPFHRVLLMTLYATVARRVEVARLKITDIDSERMVVYIRGGKGRKDRDVKLSPALLEELRTYWRGLGGSLPTGCSRASGTRQAARSPRRCSGRPVSRLRSVLGCRIRSSIHIHCGTALRRTCWKQALTCVPSRSCSGIVISKRPPSISTSRRST
jgi:integrase